MIRANQPFALILAILVAGLLAFAPELHHRLAHDRAQGAGCRAAGGGHAGTPDGEVPDEAEPDDDCVVCLTLASQQPAPCTTPVALVLRVVHLRADEVCQHAPHGNLTTGWIIRGPPLG